MRILRGNDARYLFEISGVTPELLVMRFDLAEGVSVPYELSVELACDGEVKMDDALGKEGFLTLTGDGGDRIVHGVVDRFEHVGNRGRFGLYNARVVPYLRWLSLERDCRIFQNKSVPDIVKQVLQDSGLPTDRFDFRLQASYAAGGVLRAVPGDGPGLRVAAAGGGGDLLLLRAQRREAPAGVRGRARWRTRRSRGRAG